MSTAFYSTASYKPQILSRTEGFHLPSPAPSTPPSTEATPVGPNGNSSANNNSSNGNGTAAFDTHSLFITPPSYLSVPETFRKFPGSSPGDNSSSMDFSEELASLIIQQWVTEVLQMQAEGTPKSEIPVRPEVVPVDWRRAVNRVLKLSNGGRPKITAKNFETVGTKTSLPKNLKGAAKGTRASARLTRPRAPEVPQSSSKRK